MLKKKNILILLLVFFAIPVINTLLFAQTVGEVEKTEREIRREKLLRRRLKKEKEEPIIKERPVVEEPLPPGLEKVFVKNINVRGVTLLSEKEIKDIISPFENREFTIREMRRVAGLITDAYRQKGYITSRAYLPPQKIERGILEVRIIEGVTGEIDIKGNRFFKTPLLREKIILEKGEPFNYNILRKNIGRINEHPDRSARAVLMPGKVPGSTDIALDVKDNLPIHIGFEWDNYGSRYIEKDLFRTTLTHNNLFGRDDFLSLQYQLAEADSYHLAGLRYLLPLREDLKIGFFAARTKLELGREYRDLDAWGKSRLYSVYTTKTLMDEENIDINLNLGFDYKDIFNYQLGNETSRDRLRVAKAGLDMDLTDRFGRTIIINELHYGIPRILGGLKEHDERASRVSSGGKFLKDVLNLLRLQKMPFDSTLLLKNQFQFSSYILTAAEQFQLGGVSNVRGYPPAEYVGDKGIATTVEWSFPPYFIPKDIKIPISDVKVYDALRGVLFYDWARASLRNPQAGEKKNITLKAMGCGLRVTLPDDFFAKIDLGWPLGRDTPSDDDHLHIWAQVSKKF